MKLITEEKRLEIIFVPIKQFSFHLLERISAFSTFIQESKVNEDIIKQLTENVEIFVEGLFVHFIIIMNVSTSNMWKNEILKIIQNSHV